MIRRREFITLLGSATAWPLAARAQQHRGRVRLAFIPIGSPSNPYDRSLVEVFQRGLRRVGLIENQDVVLDIVWAGDRPDQAVTDALQRGAELLIPCGSSASVAAKRQTTTGARIGEWVQTPFRDTPARWLDLDLRSGIWTKPTSTKEGRESTITLNKAALAVLRKYHPGRASDEAFVFPGVTYDSIRDDWKQLMQAARITDFRRHDLRHTFASSVLKGSKNLVAVKELLGHANIQTTSRYLHVLDEDLRAASEAAGKLLAKKRPRVKAG
jgi:Phage integrase family